MLKTSSDIDRQPLPRGTGSGSRRGWDAHHIVPAGERGERPKTDESQAIQSLTYSCLIDPNSAPNGVWLRGSKLAVGTSGYRNDLTDTERRRAQHSTVHNNDYYSWVRDYLNNHAKANGLCEEADGSNGKPGMLDSMRFIRNRLIAGQIRR